MKKNILSIAVVSLAVILVLLMITYYFPSSTAVESASITFTDKRGPGTSNPNGQIDVGNGGGNDDPFTISWTRKPGKKVFIKMNDRVPFEVSEIVGVTNMQVLEMVL